MYCTRQTADRHRAGKLTYFYKSGQPNRCGVTLDLKIPGSKLARAYSIFSLAKELNGIAGWPNSLGKLIGPSLHHCSPIECAPGTQM